MKRDAVCASIVSRSAVSSSTDGTSEVAGQGVGIPASTWQAIPGSKLEDFKGEVWLLDEAYVEFVR